MNSWLNWYFCEETRAVNSYCTNLLMSISNNLNIPISLNIIFISFVKYLILFTSRWHSKVKMSIILLSASNLLPPGYRLVREPAFDSQHPHDAHNHLEVLKVWENECLIVKEYSDSDNFVTGHPTPSSGLIYMSLYIKHIHSFISYLILTLTMSGMSNIFISILSWFRKLRII